MSTAVVEGTSIARWAAFYALRGWNALPMRPDAKRPLIRFSRYWDEPAPDLFGRFPDAGGVQLMTGRRWRLLVLDLDGPGAREWLAGLGRPVPRTWATHSGGDGVHLWFRLPADYPRPLPKAVLWRGEGDHAAAERLCDRSLIVVPPSVHPTTGRRYQFRSRAESPVRLPLPAPCPPWLLALPPLRPPAPDPLPVVPRPAPRAVAPGRYRAADVLAAIPPEDKLALAESWGVRLAARTANAAGWCPCHAIDREDRTPSAAVSARTGRYWEPGAAQVKFFDLAVRLGAYARWEDAVADLARRYGVREMTL